MFSPAPVTCLFELLGVWCVRVLACEHTMCVYGDIFHHFLVIDAESPTEPRAHQFCLA